MAKLIHGLLRLWLLPWTIRHAIRREVWREPNTRVKCRIRKTVSWTAWEIKMAIIPSTSRPRVSWTWVRLVYEPLGRRHYRDQPLVISRGRLRWKAPATTAIITRRSLVGPVWCHRWSRWVNRWDVSSSKCVLRWAFYLMMVISLLRIISVFGNTW